jgi:hypothetical protein
MTIIIPTLLTPPSLFKLVEKFEKNDVVKEVIIINNSLVPFHVPSQKTLIYTPKSNLYVNPSWNLGSRIAKHDVLCFCNDDIDFDDSILFPLYNFIFQNGGLLGASNKCFQENSMRNGLRISNTFERCYGYGTLMFIKKNDYIDIPENLKIWFGDDFLFHSQRKKNFTFSGIFINTKMETTSGLEIFNLIKSNDHKNYPFKNSSPFLKKNKVQYFIHNLIKKIFLFCLFL